MQSFGSLLRRGFVFRSIRVISVFWPW
jgi:hypothetical protein